MYNLVYIIFMTLSFIKNFDYENYLDETKYYDSETKKRTENVLISFTLLTHPFNILS